MRAIGIPIEMFTVIFAIGRMPGWIANYKEIMDEPNSRIYRPRQVYVGPREQHYVAITQRDT
jgi:citrate synthase